jgi:hypothetical protein
MIWFVMLRCQDGKPLGMTDDDDVYKLLTFPTEEAAREAGSSTLLGRMFGYEVYEF